MIAVYGPISILCKHFWLSPLAITLAIHVHVLFKPHHSESFVFHQNFLFEPSISIQVILYFYVIFMEIILYFQKDHTLFQNLQVATPYTVKLFNSIDSLCNVI